MIKVCKKCGEEFEPKKDGNYCAICRKQYQIDDLKRQLEYAEYELEKLTNPQD